MHKEHGENREILEEECKEEYPLYISSSLTVFSSLLVNKT